MNAQSPSARPAPGNTDPTYEDLTPEGAPVQSSIPQPLEWEAPTFNDFSTTEVVPAPLVEQDKTGLPEAPGTAWCDLYDSRGGKISLTTRSSNPQIALDEIIELQRYAWARYGLRNQPPKFPLPDRSPQQGYQQQPLATGTPAPRQSQQGQGQRTDFDIARIKTMKHIYSNKDSKHRIVLTVEGHNDIFVSEKVAQKAGIDMLAWNIGSEFPPYEDLQFVAIAKGSQNALFFSKNDK